MNDERHHPLITAFIKVDIDPPIVLFADVVWGLLMLFESYKTNRTSQEDYYTYVLNAALFGVLIDRYKDHNDEEMTLNTVGEQRPEYMQLVEDIINQLRHQFPRSIEVLYLTSYHLLTKRKWTRPMVATYASKRLGKPINTESWRQRVDKYVVDKNLPPIDLPKGRRRKTYL